MNSQLRDMGYVAVRELLEPGVARVLYKALLLSRWRGEGSRDNQVPTAVSFSSVPLIDALLLELQPRISNVAGCRLCLVTVMRVCTFTATLSSAIATATVVR